MKRIGTAAAAAVLAVGLTACGATSTTATPAVATSGSSSAASSAPSSSAAATPAADPAADLLAAARASRPATSARVRMDTTMTVDGRTVSYTLSGLMTMDGRTADLSGVLPAAQTGAPGDLTMHEILKDGWLYLHYSGAGAPKHWYKMPYDPTGTAAQGAGTDVAEQLRAMSRLDDLEKVGPETVRGIATTHYRGTMDTSMVAEALAKAGGSPADASAIDSSASPVEVWLDGDRRIVRQTMTMTLRMSGKEFVDEVVIDFSDWGTPMKIAVPKDARPFSELSGATG